MASRRSPNQPIRLFQSRSLEKLTVFPVGAFVAVWAMIMPVIGWAGWGTASPVRAVVLVLAGWGIWFVIEYAMHRFLFHMAPRTEAGRKFVFVMHGNHHADPQDSMRNLMPPIVSLPIAALLWAASLAALGPQGTWLFGGIMAGYVVYDLIHYGCHQWKPRGRLGQALMRHHMRHHHAHEDGNFAITGIFLDTWLGTTIKDIRPSKQNREAA